MVVNPFEFQQARVKQVLFKSQLRSMLYGVREPDAALFSLRDNPVQQWLESVVKPQFGQQPQVRDIERALQQMLAAGQGLVARHGRGQVEEARAGLQEVNTYAERIDGLLTELERGIAA